MTVFSTHSGARARARLLASCVLLAAMVPAAGHAQGQARASAEESADEEQVESGNEIVVTARFTAESDRKVGQSMTALSGAELSRTGVADFADLVGRVPSLSYGGGSPNQNTPIIRGVSSPGLSGGGDFIPTAQVVGNYFDDVPINTPSASNRDIPLYDMDRVEILRGPQGTLYGEASLGGTIRYVTADPDLKSLHIRAGATASDYWGGDWSVDGDATVNLPLVSDRLAVRATGFYRRDGGFIDYTRTVPARPDGNTFERYGGRGVLLWKPNDRLTLRAVVQIENGFVAGNYQVTTSRPLSQLTNSTILIPTTQSEDNRLYSLKASYDFDFGSLTSVTSRYDRRFINKSYFEFIGNLFGGTPFWELNNAVKLTSQELRFVSSLDGPVNFVAGLFYKRGTFTSDSITTSPDYQARFGFPTAFDSYLDQIDTQYAGFGEIYLQATKQLRLTAGGRYYVSESEHSGVNQKSILIPAGESHAFGFKLRTFLPKFALEYKPSDDVLLYANIAKGARIGGINNVVAVQELTPAERATSRTYDPDSIWSFDAGIKAMLLDKRLRLDASVFYTDWRNLQFTLYSPVTQTTYNRNVGQARTKGVEASARWQLTTSTLLQLSGSVTDAKTGVEVRTGQFANPVIPKGSPLTFVPKYGWGGAVEQGIPIGGVELKARADYRVSGGQSNNLGVAPIRSYGILDLRLSTQVGRWSLTMFAKNVTNKLVVRGAIGAQGFLITRPRSIGLSIRYAM